MIGYGFYLMEIEDHYGDLQEIYYLADSGDIIVLNQFEKTGEIRKTWKNISVKSRHQKSQDLYKWVYGENHDQLTSSIYRPKSTLNASKIIPEELSEILKAGQLELIKSYSFEN